MNKETISNIKFGLVALVIGAIIMAGIYMYQQSNKKGHSHGDGAVHVH